MFLLAILILGSAILSGHEKVKVETISIYGNATTTSDQVIDIARKDMAGRYFYLFAKNNSLIFPRFQIKRDILSEIKTVKDVDIFWVNWNEIGITVYERRPHSVWCGKDITVLDAPCYLVDKEGYIYSPAPLFSGDMYVRNYGPTFSTLNDISNINYIGSYYLFTKTYTQIFNLIQILEKNNMKVVSVSFDGFDYKFGLKSGPIIIFNDKTSFSSSFQNLFTAIETKNLDLVADAGIINYIDLRFDNKVVIGKKEKQ